MGTQRKQIFKCSDCGLVVEVLDGADCDTLSCGDCTLKLMEEQTADQSTEKHVPVIEQTDEGTKVTVGSTLHPMKEEHFIEWIELNTGDKSYRQYLKPGQDPIAVFPVKDAGASAREFCNVHGLWKS